MKIGAAPWVFAFVLLIPLLSGCVSEVPQETTSTSPARHPLVPAGFVDLGFGLGTCPRDCFEPTVAVAPDGRLFVAGSSATMLAIGEPQGGGKYAWREVPAPGFPSSLPEGTFAGDQLVQVSPSGRLFLSRLAIAGDANGFRSLAVHVVASDDGGATWPVNHAFALSGPLQQASFDRQWLGFGPAGAVVLVYKDQSSGLYLHRSTDDGTTFDAGAPIVPQAFVPGGIGPTGPVSLTVIGGPPLVQAGGRTLIPFFYARPDEGLALWIAQDEGGAVQVRPAAVDAQLAHGDFFPRLVAAPDGELWMSWRGPGKSLQLASSQDGIAWQRAVPPTHGRVEASPWLDVDSNGTLHLAWADGGGNGTTLMHATGAPGAWVIQQVGPLLGPDERPANTDFAHFALLGTQAVIPYAPGADGVLRILRTDAQVVES